MPPQPGLIYPVKDLKEKVTTFPKQITKKKSK